MIFRSSLFVLHFSKMETLVLVMMILVCFSFCAEADLPRSEGDYDHLGARSLFRRNDLAIRH